MRSAVLVRLLAATIALAACSHNAPARTGSDAAATSGQEHNTATVRTSEGTVSVAGDIDASKLGAPIYPGAQANEQGTVTTTTGKGTTTIAGFRTGDAFEKVESFYKRALPAGSELINIDSANGSVATFQLHARGAGGVVTVNVTQSKPGETAILITRATKGG
jgi:hypothetical protein